MIRTLKRGILLRMRGPLLSVSAISNECDEEAFEEFMVAIEQIYVTFKRSFGVSPTSAILRVTLLWIEFTI